MNIPVYYINLLQRRDRDMMTKQQLDQIGLTYKRFEAVQSSSGRLGCALSHLLLLYKAKKNKFPMILICEDDIYFKNPSLFKKQMNCFLKIEDDWDVLLLGGNLVPPFSLTSPYAVKVSHCQTTTGYIVKEHYYDTLIQNIREGIKLLLQFPENHFSFAIDKYWLKLQKRDKWYVIYPLMVTQRKGYSDIEKKVVDYESLMLKPV